MSSGTGTVGNIEGIDIAVIVAYFIVVIGFGIWSSLKNRGSIGGYFLSGRSMNFVLIGASLFASNIGSGHFIGLAGSGASSGIGISVFELNAIFILVVLGWIFVPVYIASGVFTMPEYLRKRFGGQRIRVYMSVLALLLSIFTKVAADLYAGAIFINQAFNWNIYAAIVLLLAIASLFTISGGLTAVIWTDFIQTIIMLTGAIYLMVVSFVEVGGYDQVKLRFPDAVAPPLNRTTNVSSLFAHWTAEEEYEEHEGEGEAESSCGRPTDTAFHLFRPVTDSLPWPGVIFGLTISAVWYLCTDQVIVQRTLASKDLSHAKAGCLLAGYLKFLPMWLIVLPGMISRILYPAEIACVDPIECDRICGSSTGCTNIAYPLLVIRLMPTGARGLMLAVMMSALMSSLTSIFNSSSTIFTMDIWTRIRKDAKDVELMIVSRVFVLFMVAVGIAWIPIVQNFAELFHYIQSVTSYLSPPICAVYVLAVLWKRTNEQGAFWGLMVGLGVGVVRFVWESAYARVPCGQEADDLRPAIIKDVHYLHFGIILFVVVFVVTVVVSLFTQPIDDAHLVRLTFWNRYSVEKRVDISILDDVNRKKKQTTNDDVYGGGGGGGGGGCTNEAFAKDRGDVIVISAPRGGDDEDDAGGKAVPWWRKSINWICGIEEHPEIPELTEKEKEEVEKKQTSLDEIPRNRMLCNVNAVILLTIAVFFWTFFA